MAVRSRHPSGFRRARTRMVSDGGTSIASGTPWSSSTRGIRIWPFHPPGRSITRSRSLPRRFRSNNTSASAAIPRTPEHSPEPGCPMNLVTWYDAAAYCRWLSEQEKVPPQEMCYPPVSDIRDGMRLPADYLQRTGYRLRPRKRQNLPAGRAR